MTDKMIVGKDFAVVRGVTVQIAHIGSWWYAMWTGSDGQSVRIGRTTRKAMLEAIEPSMNHRAKMLGVKY